MTDEEKIDPRKRAEDAEAGGQGTEPRPAALWLGAGKRSLDMGWGRGPRTLEAHELVSWFFSRDGI